MRGLSAPEPDPQPGSGGRAAEVRTDEEAVSERTSFRGLFGTASDREAERASADGAGAGGAAV